MDSNYRTYDHISSYDRIERIFEAPPGTFEESQTLPDRDRLTFDNGFYAYCTALFIDIRDSSKLPSAYQRPALAKIYRAFISEMVAILNSDVYAREVNIVGDCVWGVYNTPHTSDIDDVFNLAARANSLTRVLNYKMKQHGYTTPLSFGIGISYGRALMIKAGYNGSGINDVVYMGDVVNQASKLAAQGSLGFNEPIIVDNSVYINLNDNYQALLRRLAYTEYFHGSVVNTEMNTWFTNNCR